MQPLSVCTWWPHTQIVWACIQMISAARWALETEYPDPVSSLMKLLSTVTEVTVEHFIPVDCIAEYDVSVITGALS